MAHANDPAGNADVDLSFAPRATSGSLPDAVDAEGNPVAPTTLAPLVSRPHPAAVAAGAVPPAASEPVAPVGPAELLAALPRGDWTKVESDNDRPSILAGSRHKTLTKVVIAVVLLMLFVPMIVALVSMLNNVSASAPAGG